MIRKLHYIRDGFFDQDLFLAFSGPMSQDLMVEMGEILKTKMKLEGADTATILKAFSILIELNQNIMHYSVETITDDSAAEGEARAGCGIIAIGNDRNRYFILSGNIIETGEVERLENAIRRLNEMDGESLKKLYREKRKQDPGEKSKGAGLGFIEIARKASAPLEYDFSSIDAERSFFSLKALI